MSCFVYLRKSSLAQDLSHGEIVYRREPPVEGRGPFEVLLLLVENLRVGLRGRLRDYLDGVGSACC